MMNERKRLFWVNHYAISPGSGGGTRHFELGRELTRRGWKVVLAASDLNLHSREYTRRSGPQLRDVIPEEIEGVAFRWFWASPYHGNNWRRGLNWLSFARSVHRWRPEEVPDIVIGSSPHLFAALAAERLAARWGVPFVLEVRDLWPESLLAAGGRKGPLYYGLDVVARYLYRRASRIVVLARGSGRHLAEHLGVDEAKVEYVPNGTDVEAFARVERPDREGLTLVYAGAHGPANGLEVVLDAAERLRDETSVRFLLVGDGPSKPALVRSARERGLANVEFRDPVAKRGVPDLLAEADAGLMVLRDSPLFSFAVSPNKLFDYFGARLPVVCNVPGDVAEMVRAAAAGEQARDASADALADAVRRLLARSAAERRAMGEAGREWVAREHGRPVLADRLDRSLRMALAV